MLKGRKHDIYKQFRVYFNKSKQYAVFQIAEPFKKFEELHDCWAWYAYQPDRNRYKGKFGVIVLPRMKDTPRFRNLVSHEIQHLLIDWMLSRGMKMSARNEEKIATMVGDMNEKFWKKYIE